jgi:hypothetical protein
VLAAIGAVTAAVLVARRRVDTADARRDRLARVGVQRAAVALIGGRLGE